jgi:hypothetical protein
MRLPSYNDIRSYDKLYNSNWIGEFEKICKRHAKLGQEAGVFAQFRTDWVSEDIRYAMQQTLKYIGYGYKSAMIFKDVGEVIGNMLKELDSKIS